MISRVTDQEREVKPEKLAKDVSEYVEALKKSGVDAEQARKIIETWNSLGADADPSQIRKLFFRQSLVPAGAGLLQLFLDAGAAYFAFVSAAGFLVSEDFTGRAVLIFLCNFVGWYFTIGCVVDLARLVVLGVVAAQFGVNTKTFMLAVKELAGPGTGISVADKVTEAVNTIKVANALNQMAAALQSATSKSSSKSSVDMLQDLSTYLTLYNAKTKYGFDMSEVDLPERTVVELAALFGEYDRNDDGKLDLSEFKQLCGQMSDVKLDDGEVRAALAEMDANKDGYVEFPEIVSWYKAQGGK